MQYACFRQSKSITSFRLTAVFSFVSRIAHLRSVGLWIWELDQEGDQNRACYLSDSAGGFKRGGLFVAAFELRNIFKEDQPRRIGLGCRLNERLGDSGFAECIRPEYQLRLRTAVLWVKDSQVNQRAVSFPVRWPMRVVDGHDRIVQLVHLLSV